MRVIAISASYGAGSSVIAPLVAKALDVPYLARAVAARDSQRIESEVRETAVSEEELERGLWKRIIHGLAATPNELDVVTRTTEHPDQTLRQEATRQVRAFAAAGNGGVVLGWAAVAVLPDAFSVRLDGPPERRLLQGMAIEGLDAPTAQKRLDKTDDIRRLYWRRLHQLDWRDPDLYHLSIDSTVLDAETVADLIVRAARAASFD